MMKAQKGSEMDLKPGGDASLRIGAKPNRSTASGAKPPCTKPLVFLSISH